MYSGEQIPGGETNNKTASSSNPTWFYTEKLYNKLKPIGTQTHFLRGLPKIPKSGDPLRPIFGTQNSAYHKTGGWLGDILAPV